MSNTSDYTTNLVGNVGEKVKVNYMVDITWYAEGDSGDPWVVYPNKLVRSSGNFRNDGWIVGHKFKFYNDWENRFVSLEEFSGIITSITADGKQLNYTVDSGTRTTSGNQDNIGIWADPNESENYLTASVLRFGLVENDEPFSYQNKVTETQQVYTTTSISRTPSVFSQYNVSGIYRDWVTGVAEIALNTTGIAQNTDRFEVNHEFIILPYYVNGDLPDLQNNTIPTLLEGDSSLKYAFDIELRATLSDVNSHKVALIEDIEGFTGYFNENFNGEIKDYNIDSISYTKVSDLSSVNSLLISEKTRARITVSRDSTPILSGQKYQVYVSYLPEDDNEIKQLTTDFVDNFMYDTIQHTEGTSAKTGTGIFKLADAFVNAGTLVIDVDLEYTAAQGLRLDEDSNFLIWVQIEDASLSAGNSDRVALIADVDTFLQTDIEGLMGFDKFNLLKHNEVIGVDAGAVSITDWDEDGFLLDFDFWLDLGVTKNAVLTGLKFDLVAYDASQDQTFILDTYNFDLSAVVIQTAIQQIEIDTKRGYVLEVSDQFDFVKITTGSKVGDKQHYTGSFGQKVSWQRWLENLDVDTIFFDASEVQNNLNFKASNYSNLNNYEIKLLADADLTGLDTVGINRSSNFKNYSGDIDLYDYGTADDGAFSATLSTHDVVNDTDLGGLILRNQDTLLRTTWVNSGSPDVSDINYIIHRIQATGGKKDISELSSINARLIGDNLKPVSGETLTKVTKVGADIVSECLIDYTKLQEGINYDISARIQGLENVFAAWISGVCEVEPIVIPTPLPTVPIFCGQLGQADGTNGLYDKKLIMTSNIDFIFILTPYSVKDKGEIFVNGVIAATTGAENNNDGSADGFDPQTGLGGGGGDISLLAFDANNERFLNEASISTSNTWFIGGNPPDRIAEVEADTTYIVNPSDLEASSQIVWVKNLQAGDEVIIRVSGQLGTAWEYKTFCNILA